MSKQETIQTITHTINELQKEVLALSTQSENQWKRYRQTSNPKDKEKFVQIEINIDQIYEVIKALYNAKKLAEKIGK
jgi:hypothetical protein